jgi:uncharacterized cupredoxin-like copper-binding protein
MRFDPGQITVTEGETVAFVVTNTGQAPHEFVIGDEAVQRDHEAEMTAGGEMEDDGGKQHGDAAEVDVMPGQTATLVYTSTSRAHSFTVAMFLATMPPAWSERLRSCPTIDGSPVTPG